MCLLDSRIYFLDEFIQEDHVESELLLNLYLPGVGVPSMGCGIGSLRLGDPYVLRGLLGLLYFI
jgi:hypothetical protein